MKASIIALSLAVACLLHASVLAQTAPSHDRVVRVIVTSRSYDPFMPWRIREPVTWGGYGVWIDETHVLTTEHLVRNQTLIELEAPRSIKRRNARLRFADPLVNLALLEVDDPIAEWPPLELASRIGINTNLTILQFDDEHEIEQAEARVRSLSVTQLPNAPASVLAFHMLTDLNVRGQGAPAFAHGRLAGLVFAYDQPSRIATMIAEPFIERFLSDVREKPYRGSATAGITYRALASETKRRYLDAPDTDRGVLVVDRFPGTPAAEVLRPLDILLAWDGYTLDHLGYYDDPRYGRMDFSNLVKAYGTPGDRIPVTVWRNGAETNLLVELTGNLDEQALVPENIENRRAEYLLTGGLLLRELDADYLRGHGGNWAASADMRLTQLYLAGFPGDYQPGDHIVLLGGVLPDKINMGYQHLSSVQVRAVNGTPVRSMQDVFEVSDRDKGINRITLAPEDIEIILDEEHLDEANARILNDYGIPAIEYRRPSGG